MGAVKKATDARASQSPVERVCKRRERTYAVVRIVRMQMAARALKSPWLFIRRLRASDGVKTRWRHHATTGGYRTRGEDVRPTVATAGLHARGQLPNNNNTSVATADGRTFGNLNDDDDNE